MKWYDVDGDGNICYEEFLRGMRDPLSTRMQAMVDTVFGMMDKDGSGVITSKDIFNLYDVDCHEEFIRGEKTKDQIIAEFLDNFDGMRGNNDGKVTKQEWNDYYTDLAFSVPSEEYFVRMMEQTWCVAEDSSSQTFQTDLAQILKLFRQRLLVISNGTQEEYKLQQIFDEFDVDQNGILTLNEMGALLAKLGISVERKYLSAIIRAMDTNKSGSVEFEEFKTYVIYDPYRG